MLEKELAKKVLDECLTTGADFAEIFFEDTYKGSIKMMSSKIISAESKKVYGAGIRILHNLEEAYGYTTDLSEASMMALAHRLASSFHEKPLGIEFELKEETAPQTVIHITKPSINVPTEKKIGYLKKVDARLRSHEYISQVSLDFQDCTQYVTIANTKGKFIHDVRNPLRVAIMAYAEKGNDRFQCRDYFGGNYDIDELDKVDIDAICDRLAKYCADMVDAPLMVGGVYPVIINKQSGGVWFHEACGHSLEAESVGRGMSEFCGKLHKQIAPSFITAIDDGTIPGEFSSTNIDDEGNPTRKNVLIKNGILNQYMVDDKNVRRMHTESTGSGRRESYRFSPTARMFCTYIENGTNTLEDLIKATKKGLFAAHMGGGSVNPVTGEFNFGVYVGYMIEDGKITHPVKGATLIGNGAEALRNIDMIANNLKTDVGYCGASSGSICNNVGQPSIRIQNMTVGGAGKK